MSNNNFTNAAHAEASRRFPSGAPASSRFNAEQKTGRAGFIGGAEWARDHLAAQEATDAEIEAAAKAQYRNPDGWDLVLAAYRNRVADEGPIPDHVIGRRLELARDALLAARTARRDEEKR